MATFWHRLYRNNEVRRRELAAGLEEQQVAEVTQALAEEKVQRSDHRLRELASERKRMDKPVTGVTLTRPEALLLCVIPGIVIEVFGSAPSLDAAFELGKYLSWAFALAISGILILAAEQLGNSLASMAESSRRRAGGVAVGLVVVAIVMGVLAVISLAESRATNLAYQQGSRLNISAANSNGNFGTGAKIAKPEAKGAFAQKAPAAGDVPSSPDYDFFIPLSVLLMATATLFAYRIEMAHDWNELARAIEDTEGDRDEARGEREQAFNAQQRALTSENEIVLEASATVEREHGLLTLWMARFMAEYHRFCASHGNPPQRFSSPPVPTATEALRRVLDPRGERWAPPPPPESSPPPGPPPPPPPGGAGRNGHDGDGDGPMGGGHGGPEPSPEQPSDNGPDERRRHGPKGGPRRFGGGG